jgi:hypothetical protein
MVESIFHAWEQFKEGVSLTSSEIVESNQAERTNRENDEAIEGGYSVSPRIYRTAEIPSLLDRLRRGFRNVFSADCDSAKAIRTR